MQQLPPDDSSTELARFYEYYQQPMKRNLVKRGHEKEDADDLYQDIFLRALEHKSRWGTTLPQTDEHLNKWFYRIVRNLETDELRRKKLIIFQPLPESEAYTQLPELMVEGHEDWICDRHRLREVLAQMPLRYQQCVLLKDYGYKQKDIAAILGISESTVSEILRDVKTQLRKIYPVAVSLQQEILSFRRDFDELCHDVFDGKFSIILQTSNIGRSVQYELQQLQEKKDMGLIKCSNVLINIQAKFGKKSDPLGDIVAKKMKLREYLDTGLMADVIERIEPDRDLCNEWIRKLAEEESTRTAILSARE